MKNGALDVFYTPIFTKKNRPAVELTVICKAVNYKKFQKLLLKYTTSLGVRFEFLDRVIMKRHFETVKYRGQEIHMKVAKFQKLEKVTPEYEDCKKAAFNLGIPVEDVMFEAKMRYKQRGECQ